MGTSVLIYGCLWYNVHALFLLREHKGGDEYGSGGFDWGYC